MPGATQRMASSVGQWGHGVVELVRGRSKQEQYGKRLLYIKNEMNMTKILLGNKVGIAKREKSHTLSVSC